MATKTLPEQDVLLQLLRYDADTGKLFWRPRGEDLFPAKTPARSAALCRLWNDRYADNEAFTHISEGYHVGSVNGVLFKAHRVIWKMMTGNDAEQIDHQDGDRANNKFGNLHIKPITNIIIFIQR
jgi:hypothetical protein